MKQLNKRLQWQLDNPTRGLRFVRLDIQSLKLMVFTDASFANKQDLSSQIGFIIVLTDKSNRANILHWSSIKCKRATRSMLPSELYAMAHGFDAGERSNRLLKLYYRSDFLLSYAPIRNHYTTA